MAYNVRIYTYRFAAPGPKFIDSDNTKLNAPVDSAEQIDLKNYPDAHEVTGFETYFTGPFTNNHTIQVRGAFFDDATNKLLWAGENGIPTPMSQGWDWWNWYNIRFWIGHASWEINKPMKLRMEINITEGGTTIKSQTLYMNIVDTSVPEKKWWEKAIDFIIGLQLIPYSVKFDPLAVLYKNIFDKDLSEAEWLALKLKIADWVIPLNALSKLFYGKNLSGDSEEFGSAQDYIDLALGIIIIVPVAKLGSVGAKVFEKAGAEGLVKAGVKAAEKGAAKTTLEALMGTSWLKAVDEMKLNPLKYADLFKSLPESEMIKVLQTLRKDVAGSLARDVFGKAFDNALIASAPAWKRVMFSAAKHKWTGFFGLISLAGGAMGLDIWGNWSIIDNLQFMSGREADEVLAAFKDGTMTKEDALKELNQQLDIVKVGKAKVISSSKWNILQMIFLPLWDDIADETTEKLERAIAEITAAVVPLKKGTLVVRPDPADAKVSVEGQIPTTGVFNSTLDVGIYTVVVSKFGYISETKDMEVLQNQVTTWTPELIPEPEPVPLRSTLTIKTDPSNVLISAAGIPEIDAAGTYTLDAGTYTLDFSLEGYDSERRTVFLTEGETEILSVTLAALPTAAPSRASLAITSNPTGAQVHIDGKWAGTITPYTVKLDKGLYRLRVELKGYDIQERDISLDWGEARTEPFTLTAIELPPVAVAPKKSKITIKSEPTTADVYIDGIYTYQKTPYTAVLDAGEYLVRLQKQAYYPTESTIDVAEEETGEITLILSKIPVAEVPAEPYVPYVPYVPYAPVTPGITTPISPNPYLDLQPPDYSVLDPSEIFYSTPVDVTAPYVRELIVNIETTDVMPIAGKISSIAWIDLTDPLMDPKVITSDDEEDLVRTFLDWFDSKGFTRIVGFNVSFDHRFIFTKAALYRRPCKLWADIGMRDIMQILQQVQEKFVYSLNKAGTLDDWSKHLLGYGKYGTQEEELARFIRGDFEYVDAFNINQVNLVYDLYALLRFTLSEASIIAKEALQSTISTGPTLIGAGFEALPTTKICPNCLQSNSIENKNCVVCNSLL